jgi:ketosteroid isomerase-like protein
MTEESKTPDLVELGDRFLEAANRRDLDSMASSFAPDAVLENAGALGTFEGGAAIRGFWQDWFASYEELWVEREEILNLGNGVTFSVVNQKARLAGSSSEIRHRNAVVAIWVEGLIERVVFYTDIDEARAAAERLAQEMG